MWAPPIAGAHLWSSDETHLYRAVKPTSCRVCGADAAFAVVREEGRTEPPNAYPLCDEHSGWDEQYGYSKR